MMRQVARCAIGLLLLFFCHLPVRAQQPMITPEAWNAYKTAFLDASGRIVDTGNGGISHSEGQGYGLLLAYLAASPSDFEQIWYFTRTELLIRDDGLAAWSWNPATTPHVDDINDASDGDLLIAYALARAGAAWGRADYTQAATKIARALLDKVIVRSGGRTLLMPGASGFSAADRADGPVVNPSYWVFEAFPVLNALAPSEKWQQLTDDGVALLQQTQFGSRGLPADWVSLQRQPKPAAGFPAEFGYNAIRIPLYLIRGGINDEVLLGRLQQGMTDPTGALVLQNLANDTPKATLSEPGYRIINHIMACILAGVEIPAAIRQFAPTLYYPSTLHLLGLSYIAEMHPECL
jgi:endoglucanase